MHSIPFIIYEKADRWGGNCLTHEWNGFRYDSGAHRIHGVDPEIVQECARLLDGNIYEVNIPSRIYRNKRQFIFPLELKNIIRNMPLRDLTVGLANLLHSSFAPKSDIKNFEDLAVRRYGKLFARQFLLDYTEKLWGMPCADLDTSLTGKRLSGLHFWGLVQETDSLKQRAAAYGRQVLLPGGRHRPAHRRPGEQLRRKQSASGRRSLAFFTTPNRILAIELNDTERIEVDEVVSSLPMNRLLGMLDPGACREDLRSYFRFRNLVLVALFINKEKITDSASLYFPGSDTLFTRAYEPRNRCASMSPPGKTSLVPKSPATKLPALDDAGCGPCRQNHRFLLQFRLDPQKRHSGLRSEADCRMHTLC